MNFSALGSVYFNEDPVFLGAALQSLYDQTMKANEVVLVHDGPLTEALYQCIDAWRDKINLVEVKLEKNIGLGLALQSGLEHCRYDWVARFDGDDINRVDRFETLVSFIQKHSEFSVVSGTIEEFNENPGDTGIVRRTVCEPDLIVQYMKKRNPLNHAAVIFKKADIIDCGGYKDFPCFEDFYLWARLLDQGYRVCNVDEVLVDVRVGRGMYARRRGMKYVRAEWNLCLMKRKFGITGKIEGLIIFLMRAVPRILPARFVEALYIFDRRRGECSVAQ